MVLDFSDRREGNFYNCAVGAEHFDARSSESLSGFHTSNRTPDSPPIGRNDLDVVFPVKGLKCGECFSYFQFCWPPRSIMRAPRVPMQLRATAKDYLAYTNRRIILPQTLEGRRGYVAKLRQSVLSNCHLLKLPFANAGRAAVLPELRLPPRHVLRRRRTAVWR